MTSNFIKDCTGVILAGGENKRMPLLKAFIEIDGNTIIQHTLKTYKELFRKIVIVTNQPELYSEFGVELFGDVYDIRGPMTGILTSLLNSFHSWVFISACDMPFINRALIDYMETKRHGYDAVVPLYRGRPEPLFAFYSRRLTDSMEKAILSNSRAIKDLLSSKKVKYLTSREINRFDPGGRSIINLNTPQDIDYFLKSRDALNFKKRLRGGKNVWTWSN